MIRRLYTAAATWTVVGLAAGLYYRTLTHSIGYTNGMMTQLAVTHTHALTLGTLFMLVLLALVQALRIAQVPQLAQAFWAWQAGLLLTFGGMLVKGTLQVLENPTADSPAIAGVSGLGHVVLTVALALLFVALKKGLAAAPGTAIATRANGSAATAATAGQLR